MWWKIYFWIFTFLFGIGAIFYYGGIPVWKLGDWADIALMIVGLIGLFSFVYKKLFFTPHFWKIIFVIEIIYIIESFLYFTPLKGTLFLPRYDSTFYSDPSSGYYIVIGILMLVPFYYAIYQLAYSKKSSKK